MTVKLEGVRVLVVDGHRHMRCILNTLLRGYGFKLIREAKNSDEAIKQCIALPPDLIIVEYSLLPMSGAEFVKQVRQHPDIANPFVPVIMLTAHTEASIVLNSRDAGITEFCVKPVSISALFKRIRVCIEAPRPFVRTKKFFGPDRRRRADSITEHLKKRSSDGVVRV